MEKSMYNNEFIAHYREYDGQKQCLWEHLEQTAELSAKFAAKIGMQKQGELIGLLHDLGKATNDFDLYIRSATGLIDPDSDDYLSIEGMKGKIDHSSAGAQLIYRFFKNRGPEGMMAAQILAITVASHHCGLIDCLNPDGINKYDTRMNKDEKLTRIIEAESNLDNEIGNRIFSLLEDPGLVTGLTAQINSLRDENESRETMFFKIGLLVRFLFSCLIDADRSNTAEFENRQEKELRVRQNDDFWVVLIKRLEEHLSTLKPKTKVDRVRNDIADNCLAFADKSKGVFQLTVPTGGGKTLSSLRFALNHVQKHKMDRIIYVIPYTSIIDQNADVVRSILETKAEPATIVLEHHSNLTPEKESSRQKLLSENWDAPVVFTTMVQFLEVLFGSGTRSARRMHQLANAVIIFDEIQTLPIRCVYMFNVAIRFLVSVCNASVVLCTATQPLLDEVEPYMALPITEDKKIIRDVSRLFTELKRVEVFDKTRVGGWPEEEIAELAGAELELTGSVLIVVNTKASARNLFKLLHSKYKDSVTVFHLSTSMCPAHRMDVLNNIRNKLGSRENQPLICISTQLIEAGVDIDFGSVIRYLAGLDSIAQAAGRCNRNGLRTVTGRVLIVNPQHENTDLLIDIKEGMKQTRRVLDEYNHDPSFFDHNLIGHKAIKRYYQYYFHERRNVMDYPVGTKSVIGRDDTLFRLLSTNDLSVQAFERDKQSPCRIFLRQSFTSAAKQFEAIESITKGIIVSYIDGKDIITKLCSNLIISELHKQLKLAQRYSVNLFPYEFEILSKQNAINETQPGSGIYYLDKRYYNDDFGVSLSEEKPMDLLYF